MVLSLAVARDDKLIAEDQGVDVDCALEAILTEEDILRHALGAVEESHEDEEGQDGNQEDHACEEQRAPVIAALLHDDTTLRLGLSAGDLCLISALWHSLASDVCKRLRHEQGRQTSARKIE